MWKQIDKLKFKVLLSDTFKMKICQIYSEKDIWCNFISQRSNSEMFLGFEIHISQVWMIYNIFQLRYSSKLMHLLKLKAKMIFNLITETGINPVFKYFVLYLK
jgi:hypothetical protein